MEKETEEQFEEKAGEQKEQDLLKVIIEKESWEDVIYYVVSVEKLDPWNVDLVRLTDSFLKFVRQVKDLDFRIPAKIVFVAAILLRLKSDNLSIFEDRDGPDVKEPRPFEALGIDPNLVQLGYPMKRKPKRQVTLDELMSALKKAMTVKEKREIRHELWKERAARNIENGEDIEKRIVKLMANIEHMLREKTDEKVGFSQVIGGWNRDKIVKNLVPVLHLEQDQKIQTEQEDFFKEVFIRKRKAQAAV